MKERDEQAFVYRVRDETKQYIQDLMAEAEVLREALGVCEEGRRKIEARLDRELDEKEKLQRRLAVTEEASRKATDRYAEVERRNNDLANLYVASYQLHGSLDRDEILSTIREILINLIGTEEFAVFVKRQGDGVLRLLTSFGIDGDVADAAADERIAVAADRGEMYVQAQAAPTEQQRPLVAAIPLHLGDVVTGVIAVYRLLPQKHGEFGELDRELCSLLSRQAASAIYCTTLDLDTTVLESRPS